MSNLLDSYKEYISPALVSSAARILGENENGVSKVLGGLAPAILAGLFEKSADSNAIRAIFGSINRFDPALLAHPESLLDGGNLAHNDPKDASGQVLGQIFGSKTPALNSSMAAFSGLKPSSVSSLLGVAGPLVLAMLSKKIQDSVLDLGGFIQLLAGEKNNFTNLIPPGVGSVLGLQGFGGAAPVPAPADPAANGGSWLRSLILLLIFGAAIAYYMKYCSNQTAPHMGEPVAIVDSLAIKAAADTAKAEPAVFSKKLSSGIEITGDPEGIENKLIAFIEDGSKAVDKTTWFNFDHLNFKSASADLDEEYSSRQLNNIYEILKAFPAVKIKIGGYTDSDGDDKANMTLSQKRADTVKNALIKMGIEKGRLAAEGYGETHPECPANNTPECKAQNRRIAVRVMDK